MLLKSILGFKEIDADKRIIRGWLSRIEPDEGGDISHPEGFDKHIPMFMKNPVMFFGHEWWKKPIGKWLLIKPIQNEGLWAEGELAKGTQDAEEAWILIQQDMLKGLSFGYNIPDGGFYIDEKGYRHLTDIKILEGSLVPLGQHRLALFEAAKAKGINIISLNKAPELPIIGAHPKEINPMLTKEEVLALIKEQNSGVDTKITQLNTETETKMKELASQIKTIEQAKSTIAGIQDQIKSCATDAELKQLEIKHGNELVAAVQKLEKSIEQKWVEPPVMQFDLAGVEQAKRLGFTKNLFQTDGAPIPMAFKSALVMENKPEEAAAQLGLTNQLGRVKEFQHVSDRLFIVGAVMGMVKSDHMGGVMWDGNYKKLKTYQVYKAMAGEFVKMLSGQKALDTLTAGEGYEWLPTGMSAILQTGIEMTRGLIKRIPRFAMPTNPFTWPLQTARATAYRRGQAISNSNAQTILLSQFTTSKITFEAEGIGAGMITSYELVEDSIIAIIDTIINDLKFCIVDAEENAVINGDVSSTHQDTDVATIGTTDVRTAFSGLRYQGLNVSGASKSFANAFTYDLLVDLLGLADDYAIMDNPEAAQGFFAVSRSTYFKLFKLTEFKTLDVFGPRAVVINGKLQDALGHDIVPSVHCRQNLNTSGVNGASGNNYTAALYVNPFGFKIGDRRFYTVEQDNEILTGQKLVVATERIDLQKMVPSTHKPVTCGYYIPL